MSEEQRPSRIPEFANRKEEAEFGDTHDFTEFWDETRPVEVTISQALRDRVEARAREEAENGLVVPLARDVREELSRHADERGIGPSALVRRWVEERLRAERAVS